MDIKAKINQSQHYFRTDNLGRRLYCFNILAIFLLSTIYTIDSKAQNANFEWAHNMGSNNFDQSLGVATDINSNVYVTGFFQGTSPFYHGTDTTSVYSTSSDAFVVKYNAGGNYQWVRRLGGSSNDQGTAVVTDSKGNVYITGTFGSPNFIPDGSNNSFTAKGWSDVFLVKYDSTGNFQWSHQIGGSDGTYAYGMTVDDNDNIYVTGDFSGSVEFNPGAGTAVRTASGSGDIYLAKYDTDGNYIWVITMGGIENSSGQGVAVDSSGNIYITGFFSGSAEFDPGAGTRQLGSAGSSDVFLAKYDPNGNYIWAYNMGGSNDDYGFGIDLDAHSNIYITGRYKGLAEFNPGSGTATRTSAANSNDGFVAKYDSSGNFLWVNSIGSDGDDEPRGLVVDRSNNVYVAGVFAGSVDFNPGGSNGTLVSAGLGDGFLVKYDTDGNYTWVKGMGGSAYDKNWGVDLDGHGNIFATGHFLSQDFIPGGTGNQLGTIGGSGADGFVIKFGCGDTSSTQLQLTECGDSFIFNGVTHTASGIYRHILHNITGCDSIIILELSLVKVEPHITINEFKLGVSETYATYQWIKDGGDIPGAINDTYTVSENGEYQVRVTDENGCEGLSDVYPVNNVFVDEPNNTTPGVTIYPNPADDRIYISSFVNVDITLSGIEGRDLLLVTDAKVIEIGHLSAGVYLLQIRDKYNRLIKVQKITKR